MKDKGLRDAIRRARFPTPAERAFDFQQYRRQLLAAAALMQRQLDYARSIGCEVSQDEIQADEVQSRLLQEHWAKLTEGRP